MKDRKTCFFIGHRDAPDELRPLLAEAVERHIMQYGVTEFIVGHYGHFDAMATSAVKTAKQQYPGITLVLLLPYYPYPHETDDYDATFYPPGMENVPKPYAIVRANEYTLRNSDYLICFDSGYIGNTRGLAVLARKQEAHGRLHVENLADRM